MEVYVDYDEYNELFGGNVPSDSFEQLSIKASKYIDKITFNRINKRNVPDDVKMAACAVIDVLYKYDNGGIKVSETVGEHSVTYAISATTKEKEMYSEARIYLADTGLLYRGVVNVE